jgi:transposase
MLSFPAGFKIFLALDPVDMRKQFNGLWAAASEQLREDPRQGAVFVFSNRDRDRIKLLYWDGTGVWVLAKRLEKGRFSWPGGTGPKLALAPAELTLLLAGIDLDKTSKKSWYNIK